MLKNTILLLFFLTLTYSCKEKNIDFMLPENSILKKDDLIKIFPYFIHVYDIDMRNMDKFAMYPKGCCNTCDNDCWIFYGTSPNEMKDYYISSVNRMAELSENISLVRLKENINSGEGFFLVKYFERKPDGPRGSFDFLIIDVKSKKLFFFEFAEKKWWL